MAENNNNNFKIAEISDVILGSLKNNYFALNNYVVLKTLKNNDFAIYYDTESNITISLGKQKQLLSTINNKLSEKEFVVKQNDKKENELYFVFFTKDLVGQSNNDFVADVLLLPSDKILEILSYKNKTQDIPQRLAPLFRDHIINNKGMDCQQKISDLYNGKNNENISIDLNNNLNNNILNENEENKDENNNNINESLDVNSNINQNKNNNNIINNIINQDNNISNINNVKEEEKKIKNEDNNKSDTSNVKEEENKNKNIIHTNFDSSSSISRDLKNGQENNDTEIKTNTVSLFGLNGCYKITKEEQSNHSCGCCFW